MAINFNIPGIQSLTDALNNLKGSASNAASYVKAGASTDIGGKEHQNYTKSLIDNLTRKVSVGAATTDDVKQLAALKRKFSAMQAVSPANGNGFGFNSMGGGFRALGAMMRTFASMSPYAAGLMTSIVGTTGPLGMALGALTIGVLAAVGSFKFLEDYVGGFSARRTGSRATNEQQAIIDSIAINTGIDKNSLSSIAAQQEGGAMGFLAKINAYLSMGGDNRASQEFLHQNKLPPELSALFRLSKDQLGITMSGRDTKIDKGSEERVARATAQWNSAIERAKNFFVDFINGLVIGFKEVGKMFNLWGNRIARIFSFGQWDMKDYAEAWFGKTSKMVGSSPEGKALDKLFGNTAKQLDTVDKASKKMDMAADKMLDASEALSYTFKSGIFGGIDTERAKKAFPSNWAWSWQQLDQQNQNDMMLTGGFAS